MFGKTDKLEMYSTAITSYKQVINTAVYRNRVLGDLIGDSYMGSYTVFDPQMEDKLRKYYTDENGDPSTEGDNYGVVRDCLAADLAFQWKRRAKYATFSLNGITKANGVSHTVCYLARCDGVVKVFNSALHPLAKEYDSLLSRLVNDAIPGCELVYAYIQMDRVNWPRPIMTGPQDYCRGGVWDVIMTGFSYSRDIHVESYCQSWCILMLLHELEMTKRGPDYDITVNYMNTWPSDKKTLEIIIRRFILWLVNSDMYDQFAHEFKHEMGEMGDRVAPEFSGVLLEAFQSLHPEIEVPSDWHDLI